MSNEQQNKVPMKGTIIINPKTQRPVKVGSRTWLKLVREGLVEGKYSDPKEIYTIQEGDDVEEKIQEFNKTLPPNVQGVRGRGKYANKIVKRHKQPSTTETSRYTVKTTARKLKDRDVYEDLHEGGNFEEELEALIMGELANLNTEPHRFGQVDEEQVEEDYDDYDYEIKGDDYDDYDDYDEDDDYDYEIKGDDYDIPEQVDEDDYEIKGGENTEPEPEQVEEDEGDFSDGSFE